MRFKLLYESKRNIEESIKGILEKQYMLKKMTNISIDKEHNRATIQFIKGYFNQVSLPQYFEMGWKKHFKDDGYDLKNTIVNERADNIVLTFLEI